MSYFLISAAHKSSGKTTVSIGLTAALSERQLKVQTFKKGPDYIDPLWLSAASGRPCRNLDFFTMPREEIEHTFAQAMAGADLGLIEGNMGLYDGLDLDGSNSNAALAALLQAPVIVVVDVRGMTRGIAPLIQGYQAFDRSIGIAGVILNKVAGSRHEAKLRRVMEHYTDVPVIGAVHSAPELVIDERHLGLVPSNEAGAAGEKIRALGRVLADQIDLPQILRIAETAPPVCPAPPTAAGQPDIRGGSVRVGYPRDRAFGFYYPGDLEKMAAAGAELVAFDTLSDQQLPEVDGLFLGGGFPETAMEQLQANESLRREIHSFIERGGPVYAECGGLMYLAQRLIWRGKSCNMVGIIAADAVMHEKPQGRGYVRLRETDNMPWPRLQKQERNVAAHEFHYSTLENITPGCTYAYQVERGYGIDGDNDGLVYKNLLASYTHLRDVGGNQWTRRFVEFVKSCKDRE